MTLKHPEEFSFLVDVNLPKRFSFFNKENFSHIVDLNPFMADEEIWEYAIRNDKVILTKDTDFYFKSISSIVKPKVIFFQLGNMTLADLHKYFELNWIKLTRHLNEANLIIVQRDKINLIL